MHQPSQQPALVLAVAFVLLAALAALSVWVSTQVAIAPGTPITRSSVKSTPTPLSASVRAPHSEEGPAWQTLGAAQQQALEPLAARWPLLSEGQKRHWLQLVAGFHLLPQEEQARVQARMSEWASLSAQQRSQARLNYAVTARLPAGNKRAQWEAYQALSAEARQQLAAQAAPKPVGAATPVRPVPRKKLVRVPAASGTPATTANPPKIVLPASPQHPPQALPAPPPAPPPVVETMPVVQPSAVGRPLPPLDAQQEPHTPLAPDDTTPLPLP